MFGSYQILDELIVFIIDDLSIDVCDGLFCVLI